MSHLPGTAPSPQTVAGDPRLCFQHWRETGDLQAAALLLVEFELSQYWLEDAPPVALTAVYLADAHGWQAFVTERSLSLDGLPAPEQFCRWVERYQLLVLVHGQALELMPCRIAKPWGQEIWFSAIEQRGVCRVGWQERQAPLPWVLAVAPDCAVSVDSVDHVVIRIEPLLLLKVLDPAPLPVLGDLYFEVHDAKREAYIVTQLDSSAWPDGVGYIRYGFDQARLAASADEAAFRAEYLAAARAYESIRAQLDAIPAGTTPDPVILEREAQLRVSLDSFVHKRALRVGDVVTVPPGLPHGLLHGVRAVEFQTPVYERMILSSTQKVLTQQRWDTGSAIGWLSLTPAPEAPPDTWLDEPGIKVEKIVDFPDFEVRRVRLEAGARHAFGPIPHYAILMVLEGDLDLAGKAAAAGRALLLPRDWEAVASPLNPAPAVVFLLALPRL